MEYGNISPNSTRERFLTLPPTCSALTSVGNASVPTLGSMMYTRDNARPYSQLETKAVSTPACRAMSRERCDSGIGDGFSFSEHSVQSPASPFCSTYHGTHIGASPAFENSQRSVYERTPNVVLNMQHEVTRPQMHHEVHRTDLNPAATTKERMHESNLQAFTTPPALLKSSTIYPDCRLANREMPRWQLAENTSTSKRHLVHNYLASPVSPSSEIPHQYPVRMDSSPRVMGDQEIDTNLKGLYHSPPYVHVFHSPNGWNLVPLCAAVRGVNDGSQNKDGLQLQATSPSSAECNWLTEPILSRSVPTKNLREPASAVKNSHFELGITRAINRKSSCSSLDHVRDKLSKKPPAPGNNPDLELSSTQSSDCDSSLCNSLHQGIEKRKKPPAPGNNPELELSSTQSSDCSSILHSSLHQGIAKRKKPPAPGNNHELELSSTQSSDCSSILHSSLHQGIAKQKKAPAPGNNHELELSLPNMAERWSKKSPAPGNDSELELSSSLSSGLTSLLSDMLNGENNGHVRSPAHDLQLKGTISDCNVGVNSGCTKDTECLLEVEKEQDERDCVKICKPEGGITINMCAASNSNMSDSIDDVLRTQINDCDAIPLPDNSELEQSCSSGVTRLLDGLLDRDMHQSIKKLPTSDNLEPKTLAGQGSNDIDMVSLLDNLLEQQIKDPVILPLSNNNQQLELTSSNGCNQLLDSVPAIKKQPTLSGNADLESGRGSVCDFVSDTVLPTTCTGPDVKASKVDDHGSPKSFSQMAAGNHELVVSRAKIEANALEAASGHVDERDDIGAKVASTVAVCVSEHESGTIVDEKPVPHSNYELELSNSSHSSLTESVLVTRAAVAAGDAVFESMTRTVVYQEVHNSVLKVCHKSDQTGKEPHEDHLESSKKYSESVSHETNEQRLGVDEGDTWDHLHEEMPMQSYQPSCSTPRTRREQVRPQDAEMFGHLNVTDYIPFNGGFDELHDIHPGPSVAGGQLIDIGNSIAERLIDVCETQGSKTFVDEERETVQKNLTESSTGSGKPSHEYKQDKSKVKHSHTLAEFSPKISTPKSRSREGGHGWQSPPQGISFPVLSSSQDSLVQGSQPAAYLHGLGNEYTQIRNKQGKACKASVEFQQASKTMVSDVPLRRFDANEKESGRTGERNSPASARTLSALPVESFCNSVSRLAAPSLVSVSHQHQAVGQWKPKKTVCMPAIPLRTITVLNSPAVFAPVMRQQHCVLTRRAQQYSHQTQQQHRPREQNQQWHGHRQQQQYREQCNFLVGVPPQGYLPQPSPDMRRSYSGTAVPESVDVRSTPSSQRIHSSRGSGGRVTQFGPYPTKQKTQQDGVPYATNSGVQPCMVPPVREHPREQQSREVQPVVLMSPSVGEHRREQHLSGQHPFAVLQEYSPAVVKSSENMPRHFDFLLLEIGHFVVFKESEDFCQNRLKVMFAQRKMVYEFGFNSLQYPAASGAIIEVPFESIVAIGKLNDVELFIKVQR
ncbi:PREDICTED: uncharacterized protein LOC106821412 isoform X2 [Priapulus caudatus]|nr:PREDICTED: uncharacterized protein LOC106821412 isoform X2 [Priapulus caudatus]